MSIVSPSYSWDRVSSSYQKRYRIRTDDIHYGPMCPPESEAGFLGEMNGLNVLDYGCGGGQNTIASLKLGAACAIGLDPSVNQISFARSLAKNEGSEAKFYEGDFKSLANIDLRFDVVISAYSLMFEEDVLSALRAIRGVMADGSTIIVSVDHPMRISGEWFEDKFVVSDYFGEGWKSWNYDFPEDEVFVTMHRFHRTVSTWVRTLVESGFSLQSLIEPKPIKQDSFGLKSKYGSGSPKNVFSSERLNRVPGTLIMIGRGR